MRAESRLSGQRDRWATLGGVLWIVASLQFTIVQPIVAAAWNPPYSWTNNYISDLGNTACGEFSVPHGEPGYVCSPLSAAMNASFVVSGLLVIAGALLVYRSWPRGKLGTTALLLWLIAGVGKVGVGLVPENTNVGLHLLAAANIPVESIAILLVSLTILHSRVWLGWLGIVLALLGVAGTVLGIAGELLGPGLYLGLGVGGMERVAEYPGTLWRVLFGLVVLTSAGLAHRPVVPDVWPGGAAHASTHGR